jgi:hypothetical protein
VRAADNLALRRIAPVCTLVNDANALVMALGGQELEESATSAVGLLALVAGQDVEPAEGSDGTDGRWRIARRVAADRVISVNDPQARHTRKSAENRRDGYRARVAAEPETGIITDEQLTRAAGEDNSDAAVAAQFVASEAAGTGMGCRWYGDAAYGTGDLGEAISVAGDAAVIKPWPLQPAVEGGFSTDDFTVYETAGTVTCPAGLTRLITASHQTRLPHPTAPARLAAAGRATTLPARKGLAYCRTDGLVGALPAPRPPLFQSTPTRERRSS